jgi:hypothetical protein
MSSAQGTLRLTQDFLVFSVQVTLFGALKRPPTTIKVAPEALYGMRYKRGLFHDTVSVRPHEPDLLAAMPGDHHGEIRLQVKKEYRREAERLVDDVRSWARLDLYD